MDGRSVDLYALRNTIITVTIDACAFAQDLKFQNGELDAVQIAKVLEQHGGKANGIRAAAGENWWEKTRALGDLTPPRTPPRTPVATSTPPLEQKLEVSINVGSTLVSGFGLLTLHATSLR